MNRLRPPGTLQIATAVFAGILALTFPVFAEQHAARAASLLPAFSASGPLPSLRTQTTAPGTAQIAAVKVSGSRRFTEADIARAVGLEQGKTVGRAEIQAAADKLSGLGWFDDVRFGFRTVAKGVEIQFTLRDAPSVPVWFDNFPWFSDRELDQAIRDAVGLYDGTAPEGGSALDSMRDALEALLRKHGIEGAVEGSRVPAPGEDTMIEEFRVAGQSEVVRVASLEFSDATAREAAGLQHSLDEVVGKAYSRYTMAVFVIEKVRPTYAASGHLRARFGEPHVEFSGDPGKPLPSQVAVRIPIEPGVQYHWGVATWSGETAFNDAALNSLLGFLPGEPANGLRLEAGWSRITAEYGKQGYLEAKLEPVPHFDDAAGRVSYHVRIAEGIQYRMGQIVITGLSLAAERQFLANWRIARGDIFDNQFFEQFISTGVRKMFADTPVHFEHVGHLLRPNQESRTVDVLLDFK
jgi:outer membrane protein assembly factor BamA